MDILHVVSSLDPAAGGLPAVAARLAAAQGGLGYVVHLAYHCWNGEDPGAGPSYANVPGFERVNRHPIPPPARLDALVPIGVRRAVRSVVERVDVVHVHGVWDAIGRGAADVARITGKPYVVAPHGMLDPWSLSQRAIKKKLALLLAYRAMLNRAAFLHVLNRDEGSLLAPLKLTSPVEIVPNGVFPEEVSPLPLAGRFRARHARLGARPYVLFLSRLHRKKGLDILADAFAVVRQKMPGAMLVVAGPDDGARSAFEEQVAELGMTDHVLLTGPIYGVEKLEAIVDAACFCLPSRQEGFSMAITEALACGTPVVASEQCHFHELAEHGAGKVVPLSAIGMAKALLDVLTMPLSERTRMGEAGRRLVMVRYVWPAIAERTVELYRTYARSS